MAAADLIPTDLGKGISNGAPVDCYSVVGGMTFRCKIGLGSPSYTAPVSIIMEPNVNIAEGATIKVHFPKIKLPLLARRLTFF